MKDAIDNFSEDSSLYKKFRPRYPVELYNYLYSFVSNFRNAWDCGTGNGQVAIELAKRFDQVLATDLSAAQLEQVDFTSNINYKVHRSEQSFDIDVGRFDLITVAQAVHWFDIDAFFNNVYQYLEDDGVLAIWGYGKLYSENTNVNDAIDEFYANIVGPFWDKERSHIDNCYADITHDKFAVIRDHRSLIVKALWTSDRLGSYLKTWSAVKHFIKEKKHDPVDLFYKNHSVMNYKDHLVFQYPIFIKIFKKA